MDFGSLKRKYRLLWRKDPNNEFPPKTKSALTSIRTCCKRRYSVCVWLIFLGFFVCTNIFHMLDMKYISVSVNSMIYIEFMENDSSKFYNETVVGRNKSSSTLPISPFTQSTVRTDTRRTKRMTNVTIDLALPPFVLRCDVLNVAVSSLPSSKADHFSSEPTDSDIRRTTNRWAFLRRKRENNLQIQFSASTALPPKKRFLVRSALLPRLHSTVTDATLESSRGSGKKPSNFLRISFNKTNTGSTDRFSRNISTRTVEFNPDELKRCLTSSVSNDYRCFWDGVETNSLLIDEAVQDNRLHSSDGRSIKHEFTGVTLWNVLHRLQSCDVADYVLNSIIEDSTTMNEEKATFISFRGPSFDSSSVLLDAGYHRSYEHTATPFCKYTSTMLVEAFEQFLSRQRQYQTERRIISQLKDSESTLDRKDLSLNDTEIGPLSDDSVRLTESNVTSDRWLFAYIIVQYQPIESSYDPILVPVSTPRFSLDMNELSWRYDRHLHPPKTNVLGFDHIYQNICATAISMPLDGSAEDPGSIFHTALAMQDCFDSTIWNQQKGSIVSCRYSILNDLDTDNSTDSSPDDSIHCRHTLERTMQDILMQNHDTA